MQIENLSQIDKQLELGHNQENHGQNVALLETPNGITLLGASKLRDANGNGNGTGNGNGSVRDSLSVERRHQDEDDSFEYGTDRESSVYNPTTRPLKSILMSQAGGRNSRSSTTSDKEDGNENADLLQKGNQLGIPESRFSRWLPKDQRELIEKQAMLLSGRANKAPATPPKPQKPQVTAAPTSVTPTSSNTATASSPTPLKLPQETEIWACVHVCVYAHVAFIFIYSFFWVQETARSRIRAGAFQPFGKQERTPAAT